MNGDQAASVASGRVQPSDPLHKSTGKWSTACNHKRPDLVQTVEWWADVTCTGCLDAALIPHGPESAPARVQSKDQS